MATELKNVPSFPFDQDTEKTITVAYYNGTVCLEQGDNTISIEPEKIKELFRLIIKHQPEAQNWLDKKFK